MRFGDSITVRNLLSEAFIRADLDTIQKTLVWFSAVTIGAFSLTAFNFFKCISKVLKPPLEMALVKVRKCQIKFFFIQCNWRIFR